MIAFPSPHTLEGNTGSTVSNSPRRMLWTGQLVKPRAGHLIGAPIKVDFLLSISKPDWQRQKEVTPKNLGK